MKFLNKKASGERSEDSGNTEPSTELTAQNGNTLAPSSVNGTQPGSRAPTRPGTPHSQAPSHATNRNATYAPTQVTYADATFAKPPELNYSLWPRKRAISIFWFLVLVDCIAVPIALYFALWYHTDLSPNAVFSISTACLGGVSIFEYFIRFHRLWKKGSTCRVIGARRYYLDWFQWNLSVGWTAVMIELIVGTIPKYPPIRLLAMPVPSMVFAFGCELLLIDGMRYAKVLSPVRISSLPRGVPLRPGIYSIIEDVVAVDGSGGTEFRQRLNLRYQASHYFRQMLHRLTLFWAAGSCGIAVVSTVLIFTLGRDAAYVVGWTVPFVWAGIWALITWLWVRKSLDHEQRVWTEERAAKV